MWTTLITDDPKMIILAGLTADFDTKALWITRQWTGTIAFADHQALGTEIQRREGKRRLRARSLCSDSVGVRPGTEHHDVCAVRPSVAKPAPVNLGRVSVELIPIHATGTNARILFRVVYGDPPRLAALAAMKGW